MDWTSPEGIAELETLADEAEARGPRHPEYNDPHRYAQLRENYRLHAGEAAPALIAEIRRLREREAVLVGLLREAHAIVSHYEPLTGSLTRRIDAALTPGGSDGR